MPWYKIPSYVPLFLMIKVSYVIMAYYFSIVTKKVFRSFSDSIYCIISLYTEAVEFKMGTNFEKKSIRASVFFYFCANTTFKLPWTSQAKNSKNSKIRKWLSSSEVSWSSQNFTNSKISSFIFEFQFQYQFRVSNFTNFTNSILLLNKIFILINTVVRPNLSPLPCPYRFTFFLPYRFLPRSRSRPWPYRFLF